MVRDFLAQRVEGRFPPRVGESLALRAGLELAGRVGIPIWLFPLLKTN